MPDPVPVPVSVAKTATTKPSTSSATITEPVSTKKLFLRDRIAKKKEIEDAELGAEEAESSEKNEKDGLFVQEDAGTFVNVDHS